MQFLGSRGVHVHQSPTAEQLDLLWRDLEDADANKAYRALVALKTAGHAAVTFLNEHLSPAPAADSERLNRIVKSLSSDAFAAREQASRDLFKIGDAAAPALRKQLLAGSMSPEARRRAEAILRELDVTRSPARLRELRAVEVLELIGTPEARQLLNRLVLGEPDAALSRDAKAALDRLQKPSR
jgi:hypothetical protein